MMLVSLRSAARAALVTVALGLTLVTAPNIQAAPPVTQPGGTSKSLDDRVAALEAALAAQASKVTSLETANATQANQITALQTTASAQATTISNLQTTVTEQATKITTLETTDTAQQAKLAPVSVEGSVFTISGVNVRIVDGSGFTSSTSGLGNLAVGYNELRYSGDVRTGSHNLILGIYNNYSSFGGLVAGKSNSISAGYASVIGGHTNTASGVASSVSGGRENTASGSYASVSGGANNTSSGDYASISGGRFNTASGAFSYLP